MNKLYITSLIWFFCVGFSFAGKTKNHSMEISKKKFNNANNKAIYQCPLREFCGKTKLFTQSSIKQHIDAHIPFRSCVLCKNNVLLSSAILRFHLKEQHGIHQNYESYYDRDVGELKLQEWVKKICYSHKGPISVLNSRQSEVILSLPKTKYMKIKNCETYYTKLKEIFESDQNLIDSIPAVAHVTAPIDQQQNNGSVVIFAEYRPEMYSNTIEQNDPIEHLDHFFADQPNESASWESGWMPMMPMQHIDNQYQMQAPDLLSDFNQFFPEQPLVAQMPQEHNNQQDDDHEELFKLFNHILENS